MKFNLTTLRWIALIGLAAVLLQDLYASFPLQPRQTYGLVLLILAGMAVVFVALALMPRAAGALVQHLDLLVPLALVTIAGKLLGWLAGAPVLGALLSPALPLRLLNLSFGLSFHFLFGIMLAVAYATWMTAVVLALVRTANGDPCVVMPSAMRWFWRVMGMEFIGWGMMLFVTGLFLMLMPVIGWVALAPMLVFAIAWNFATAAVLPAALVSGLGFWPAFRAGVAGSLAQLSKWWLLLLAQMLLLGLLMFFYSRWGEGNSHHANVSWNVNAFWTGGYENDCRWYSKLTEVYKTSKLPWVETMLALLLGAMAVAIKIAIVQRMQPQTPPFAPAPPVTALPMEGPPATMPPASME